MVVVVATLRDRYARTGLCPFDPYRDLKPVAELITVAFGDKLDPAGQIALAEMRRIARWGWLLWWLRWSVWSSMGATPGFVWVEEGRVVGNVSLRRALERSGFIIGNVAVHPDWQRRGIARQLVEAAIDEVAVRGGRWVGLEVRVDNPVAHRLYEQLGFQKVGTTTQMLRPKGLSGVESAPPHSCLRRGRYRDSAELIGLVHAIIPERCRPLLELRKRDYQPGWEHALSRWLVGRHESWWVFEENESIRGAVRTLRKRGRHLDRLEILVAPEYVGRIESVLVRQGLANLSRGSPHMVEVVLPAPTGPLIAALERAGFRRSRVLMQMQLRLTKSG
jgi:ribosomal protein S18 acetylase RimI-like enzyme